MMTLDEYLKTKGVNTLDDVNYPLAASSRVYHVGNLAFPINSFNASGTGDRRFDPVTIGGNVIGTYYFAQHPIDAIAETLYRMDATGQRFCTGTNKNVIVQSDLVRDMNFLDLSEIPDTRIQEALGLGQTGYRVLQGFAAMFLRLASSLPFDGLTWISHQRAVPGQRCFVLFGDRATSADLEARVVELLRSQGGYAKLRDAFVSLSDTVNLPNRSDLL